MEHLNFSKITACGECCFECRKKEEGFCDGCIETDGNCQEWSESKGCPIHKCAKQHNVQFCGLCEEFPCEWLIKKATWKQNLVEKLSDLADIYYKEASKKKNLIIDYEANTLDNIKFVGVYSTYKNKWVFCFHKYRETWEPPGGHVEEDESPLDAAKRELYEETGAVKFDIVAAYDYKVYENGKLHNHSRTYYANIQEFEEIDKSSEMSHIGFFDECPENFTYDKEKVFNDMLKTQRIGESLISS